MGAAVLVILIILGALALVSVLGSVINVIIPILIWAVVGWLAGQIMRGRGYSIFTNILLGLGGGILGGLIFGLLGLGSGGLIGSIVSGVVGAVALIYVVRLVSDNKRFGT